MAGDRTVPLTIGDASWNVDLTFQLLKLLCERDFDPYVILAEYRLRPSPSLGLNTTRAIAVLSLATGEKPDVFWKLATQHRPITVIDAAADVLIAYATAGAAGKKPGADADVDDSEGADKPPKG